MSVINKKPLINQILDGLNTSQLATLKACINGNGPAPIFRSLKPISNAHLTTDDYGVKPIKLELAIPLGGMSIYEGYLIYTASMCYVICYSGEANQCLTILKVDVAKNDVKIMDSSLSILGLRSELDDAPASEGAEIISVIEDAPSGTIASALGLDASGGLVKGTISGGTQLYKHTLGFDDVGNGEVTLPVDVIMLTSTRLTSSTFTSGDYRAKIISILYSINTGKALYFFQDTNNKWNIRQQDDHYKDLMDGYLGDFINDTVTSL